MSTQFRNLLLLTVIFLSFHSCNTQKNTALEFLQKEKIVAWCIVPFDSEDRTPEERAQMLDELGIRKFAYDYRDRHIPFFSEEIAVLQEHDIELSAVWLWIQDLDENLLDPASEAIVKTVEESGVKTCFWISFPAEFFENLDDASSLKKAVGTISELNKRLLNSGCSIALYNHGDWFGNVDNQIRIIEEIGSDNISMVYNFHHAHHEIDLFEELFTRMLPYLSTVNINGMRKEGPKIITPGEGDQELKMIDIMVKQGYTGQLGIIGHTEGEDIRLVLERNLKGLDSIKNAL